MISKESTVEPSRREQTFLSNLEYDWEQTLLTALEGGPVFISHVLIECDDTAPRNLEPKAAGSRPGPTRNSRGLKW
jgi:hypothetical protein